jgi:hypothetical protein
VGYKTRAPRTPAVFDRKAKHHKYDDADSLDSKSHDKLLQVAHPLVARSGKSSSVQVRDIADGLGRCVFRGTEEVDYEVPTVGRADGARCAVAGARPAPATTRGPARPEHGSRRAVKWHHMALQARERGRSRHGHSRLQSAAKFGKLGEQLFNEREDINAAKRTAPAVATRWQRRRPKGERLRARDPW